MLPNLQSRVQQARVMLMLLAAAVLHFSLGSGDAVNRDGFAAWFDTLHLHAAVQQPGCKDTTAADCTYCWCTAHTPATAASTTISEELCIAAAPSTAVESC
jgi:hypothetical protein